LKKKMATLSGAMTHGVPVIHKVNTGNDWVAGISVGQGVIYVSKTEIVLLIKQLVDFLDVTPPENS